MSKKIEAKVTCPNCQHQFDFTLYRSIWGEYPENRELVMSDKINVATCSKCGTASKLPFALIYTNADRHFAVWWEPSYDAQIDADTMLYTQTLGEGNYMATAPRIKDWEEFKNTIIKFEKGELEGKPAVMSSELQDKMQGFLKHIENQNKQSKSSGCLLVFAIIIPGLLYALSQLLG